MIKESYYKKSILLICEVSSYLKIKDYVKTLQKCKYQISYFFNY